LVLRGVPTEGAQIAKDNFRRAGTWRAAEYAVFANSSPSLLSRHCAKH
jgi:hypothetical protein